MLAAILMLLLTTEPLLGSAQEAQEPQGLEVLRAVPAQRVELLPGFWQEKLRLLRASALPFALERLESRGRLANFALVADSASGSHQGGRTSDVEVYGVLEGVARALAHGDDAALRERADAIVDRVVAAQGEDGYLHTYTQLVEPERRWKGLKESRELQSAGRLIDAALAWDEALGDTRLLAAAERLAQCIDERFERSPRKDPPGYPGLEASLLRLAVRTEQPRWAELASYFLDQRGSSERRKLYGEFAQDATPLVLLVDAHGHAARGAELYAGIVERASYERREEWLGTLLLIWNDAVRRKMHVTGGFGGVKNAGAFPLTFDVGPGNALGDTAAAAALVRWGQGMARYTAHATFPDAVERALYNALLAGVSLDGQAFASASPIESYGRDRREPWFDEATAAVDLLRTLSGVAGLAYLQSDDDLYVAQYMASEVELELGGQLVRVRQETDYPWSSEVVLTFELAEPATFEVHLRVPGWCARVESVGVNGAETALGVTHGADPGSWISYARLWESGERLRVVLDMPPRRVPAPAQTAALAGCVALARGPLVYALEAVDHDGSARHLALPAHHRLEYAYDADLLGGCTVVTAKAVAVHESGGRRLESPRKMTAVPFHLWNNRGEAEMRVWIPESPAEADLPGQSHDVRRAGRRIKASHVHPDETLEALTDGEVPHSSGDQTVPRASFRPHAGTREWVQLEYDVPRTFSATRVFWYDDTGLGPCRRPASWRLSFRAPGGDWTPVTPLAGQSYGTELDAFQELRFHPVRANAMRLEVELRAERSGGLLEWELVEGG